MNFEFTNINVADIEKKINLKHKAETDGRNNIPPTNSVVRSITEEEAITEYDNIRHNDVDKAVNFLDPIKNKIIGYKSIVNLISLRNELPKKKIYNLCLELKK